MALIKDCIYNYLSQSRFNRKFIIYAESIFSGGDMTTNLNKYIQGLYLDAYFYKKYRKLNYLLESSCLNIHIFLKVPYSPNYDNYYFE